MNFLNIAYAEATTTPELIGDMTDQLTADIWGVLPQILSVTVIIIGVVLAVRLVRRFIGGR